MAAAIEPAGAGSGPDRANDIVAPGIAHHQQLLWLAAELGDQGAVERRVRLDRAFGEAQMPNIDQIAQEGL